MDGFPQNIQLSFSNILILPTCSMVKRIDYFFSTIESNIQTREDVYPRVKTVHFLKMTTFLQIWSNFNPWSIIAMQGFCNASFY